MQIDLQYISNNQGQRSAVIIPLEQWKVILQELNRNQLLQDLREAFEEVRMIESGEIEPLTIKDLLDEL